MRQTMTGGALLLLTITFAGCSSHTIYTTGNKTTASFKNKSVQDVVDVLTKNFPPLKDYTAQIPAELRHTRITMSFDDASTIEPVKTALEEATGYAVEVDTAKKTIRFVKK